MHEVQATLLTGLINEIPHIESAIAYHLTMSEFLLSDEEAMPKQRDLGHCELLW